MDEYMIKDEAKMMDRTDLTHAVSTMTVTIDAYNDMQDAGRTMLTAHYPGLTDQEREDMCEKLKGISNELSTIGDILIAGRKRFYAEQGIRLNQRETTFSSERD